MTTEALGLRGPSFASRAAARARWESRYAPADPEVGLVCIYDADEPIENRRTKEITGVQRVRHYAHKNNLMTTVAARTDDGPLVWWEQPAAAPLPKPRTTAVIRRYRGNRPAMNR